MKKLFSAIILLSAICSFDAYGQLTINPRYYHFEGNMGEAFKNGVGLGVSACPDLDQTEAFHVNIFYGATLSKVWPVADTIPSQAYVNGNPINGAWERYFNVYLLSLDLDGLFFLTDDDHWKPFVGGAFVFHYFNYNYENYVPGLIDEQDYNDFLTGGSIGPTAGLYYLFNDKIGLLVKAEQTWGWVFKEGPVRINYNALDVEVGINISFGN